MTLTLELADLLEFALGGGLGQEVVNAGLGGDCRGGERIVARHHDGLDAHLAQVGELLLNAGLDDVLEVHNAQHAAVLGHDQRGAAGLGDAFDGLVALLGEHAAGCLHIGAHGIGSALADLIALVVHTGHASRRGEGDELHALILECAAAQPKLLLGEHDDGTTLGGLVGQRGKLSGIGQLRGIDAVDRDELGGLAVTQGDGAGLVEHEDVDVAGGLDGAAGHGQHVGLVQTAHAGDADGGQKGADGSGSQAHEQCHERGHGRGVDHVVKTGREAGVTIQGQRDQDKDDGKGHQEDLQSDLVRGLLARGTLDHRDHLVQEALAGLTGDLDDDPVGQHRGTAGNGRAVAAGLADHGGGLAGDGGLVNGGSALDDVAIAGNLLAGAYDHQVAARELGAGNDGEVLLVLNGLDTMGLDILLGRTQGIGLSLTAALGKRLGEVREQVGEPQDDRDGDHIVGGHTRVLHTEDGSDGQDGGHDGGKPHQEHDRVLNLDARIQFGKRVADRAAHHVFLHSHKSASSFTQSSGRTRQRGQAPGPGRSSGHRSAER